MNELTEIKLYGYLGEKFGQDWSLSIGSVSEALKAIDVNCGGLFCKALIENDLKGIKYKIIVNNEDFHCEKYEKSQDPKDLVESSLFIRKRIQKLEIAPCIQGAELASMIAGAGLAFLGSSAGSSLMMMAGLGLIAAGVASLLSTPPPSEDFKDISTGGGVRSYLFNGPQNTVGEGGPVPLGYGRLIIGSQLVSYSSKIGDKEVKLLDS